MWDYIKGVNSEGTTVFLTTHYMDEADHLSDRISIIDNGKIIITGTTWGLKNSLGRDHIYLETSDNERAIGLLQNMTPAGQIHAKTKGFNVSVTIDGTKALPGILDTLRRGGIEVTTINIHKPTMDDVFVFYTGKEFRDEPTGKTPVTHIIPRGR
jgi:ABC-2 type transport system ATP-binding protein